MASHGKVPQIVGTLGLRCGLAHALNGGQRQANDDRYLRICDSKNRVEALQTDIKLITAKNQKQTKEPTSQRAQLQSLSSK